ncbi:MAG: hypothetical protein DWQ06_04175 [Calditrichaeota bacterium]|nr:MAG: hypothetical protein DWQ06_04175 [Calditrichota bacterium]
MNKLKVKTLEKSLQNLTELGKIEILLEISKFYEKVDFEKSINFSEQALKLAQKHSFKEDVAHKRVGKLYLQNGKLEEALEIFKQGLEKVENVRFSENIAEFKELIAGIYYQKFEYRNSLKFYYESYRSFLRIGKVEDSLSILQNLARIYAQWNEFGKALKCLFKALEIAKESNNLELFATVMNNVGIVYRSKLPPDYTKSKECFEKAIEIGESIKVDRILISSYGNYGVTHLRFGEFEKALGIFNKVLEIQEKTNDEILIANTLVNIGICLSNLDKFDEAINHHQNALKIFIEKSDKLGILTAFGQLGLVNFAQKKYQDSLKYSFKAVEIANELSLKRYLKGFYKTITDIYSEMEKFEEAFKFHKKYNAVTIQIYEEQNVNKLNEMEAKFETEVYRLKNIELANLNQSLLDTQKKLVESERKRTFLATVVAANHEMNQPLTTLLGNVNLLQMHLQQTDDEKSKKHLNKIENSAERISNILQKLQEIDDPILIEYLGDIKMIDIHKKK